jgi:hypothetical protein
VNTIYGFLKFLIRKNQAGSISATDFFYVWNAEQSTYQQDLIGNWHRINNTKEGNNIGLIQSEVIMNDLAPFIIHYTGNINSGTGNKPGDLIYTLALRINNTKVFQVNHDQIWAVKDDVIDPPDVSEDSYYYSEYSSGGQLYYSFLPATVTQFELDYVAACVDVVWGFTFDSNQRQVYDVGTSTQPQWQQPQIIEITKRTLKNLGVSFKDQDFSQFGQSNIQTGD